MPAEVVKLDRTGDESRLVNNQPPASGSPPSSLRSRFAGITQHTFKTEQSVASPKSLSYCVGIAGESFATCMWQTTRQLS